VSFCFVVSVLKPKLHDGVIIYTLSASKWVKKEVKESHSKTLDFDDCTNPPQKEGYLFPYDLVGFIHRRGPTTIGNLVLKPIPW